MAKPTLNTPTKIAAYGFTLAGLVLCVCAVLYGSVLVCLVGWALTWFIALGLGVNVGEVLQWEQANAEVQAQDE